jgi:hypothetical protein
MPHSDIRNRVIKHVRVRAGDLVPHEHNARVHPEMQRHALADLYAEVGFARSLLAYETADGRLKLIDGHLRQALTPDMIVDVEVLDVNDDEARKLLLSLDPLAALAEHDTTRLDELRSLTSTDSDALANLWRSLGATAVEETLDRSRRKQPDLPAAVKVQHFVLIECPDEATQLALLERFQREGLTCRALLS